MIPDLSPEIWGSVAVFLRMGAAIFLVPVLGEGVIPVRIRLGLALALTALVTPLVGAELRVERLMDLLILVLSETGAGLVFAALLRLFLWALEVVGAIASQSVGMSQILGRTQLVEASSALSQTLTLAGLALLCAIGWPVTLVGYLADTYTVWPIGAPRLAGEGLDQFMAELLRSFALALQLATPFYATGLLYNAALGIISRAMPQLMVVMIGAPAITGLGILLFAVAAPFLLSVWLEVFVSR